MVFLGRVPIGTEVTIWQKENPCSTRQQNKLTALSANPDGTGE